MNVKKILSSFMCFFVVIAFMGSASFAPALADGPLVTGTILGGLLTEVAPAAEAFTGTPGSTSNYTIPIQVSDLTGTGNGWNLTITSTTFTNGTDTFPTNASTITGVTGACTIPGTCSQNTLTNTVSPLPTVPAGTPAPTPVKFFGTASGTGRGIYTVTPTILVTIPAAIVTGVYTSTVSLAIAAGP